MRLEKFQEFNANDAEINRNEHVYIITSPLFDILQSNLDNIILIKIGKHTGSEKHYEKDITQL
jgi:hypothetical protein